MKYPPKKVICDRCLKTRNTNGFISKKRCRYITIHMKSATFWLEDIKQSKNGGILSEGWDNKCIEFTQTEIRQPVFRYHPKTNCYAIKKKPPTIFTESIYIRYTSTTATRLASLPKHQVYVY